MNVVGKVGSLITRGVYSVATPFHPFGGAVDIIVVEQQDGSFRSTPWYIRFGKFQGVLKGSEKTVRIFVNGVEANFHMFLDNSGEAYFLREAVPGSEDTEESDDQNSKISDSFNSCYGEDILGEIEDEQLNVSVEINEEVDVLDDVQVSVGSDDSNSEMVLMSIDGHVIKAPISGEEEGSDDVQLSIPKFHLGPGDGSGENLDDGDAWTAGLFCDLDSPVEMDTRISECRKEVDIERDIDCTREYMSKDRDMFKSCLDLTAQIEDSENSHSSELGIEKRVESNCSQETSSVDIKLEEAKSIAEHKLGHSGLTSSDIPSSADVQAVVLEEKDFEYDSSEKKEISPLNACSKSDQHLEDSEQKPLDMENTSHECSAVSPVHSVSIETECATEEEYNKPDSSETHISGFGFEISSCGDTVQPGIGRSSAAEAFETHRISEDAFMKSGREIIKNGNIIVRYRDEYFTWDNIAHIIVGKSVFGMKYSVEPTDPIPIEQFEMSKCNEESHSRRWRLWPIPFRRVKTFKHSNTDNSNSEDVFLDSKSCFESTSEGQTQSDSNSHSPRKLLIRTNIPTSEQIASLNLKDGQNTLAFSYSTRVLGVQQVDAHIYLWKWNTKIVISDVDGTITRSDVLGQVMPLVGRDWTQSGVARLFSAIKENGYQLLFLSARAIVQAYLTKSYLFNLKQDGKALPTGPVVISPDGLFPSLYREVIRRAPHEFKIACLKDIRALFPSDYNPFYAGFGNRDTDELSYTKMGIPKGKIFIINPKGEVALCNCTDVRSYTSLHTLVHDMFPPTSISEQEDFNSWNYWKLPLPSIEDDC